MRNLVVTGRHVPCCSEMAKCSVKLYMVNVKDDGGPDLCGEADIDVELPKKGGILNMAAFCPWCGTAIEMSAQ